MRGKEPNLSVCPYYAKYYDLPWQDHVGDYGPGTCIFGCYDEPECVTFGPWKLTIRQRLSILFARTSRA